MFSTDLLRISYSFSTAFNYYNSSGCLLNSSFVSLYLFQFFSKVFIIAYFVSLFYKPSFSLTEKLTDYLNLVLLLPLFIGLDKFYNDLIFTEALLGIEFYFETYSIDKLLHIFSGVAFTGVINISLISCFVSLRP